MRLRSYFFTFLYIFLEKIHFTKKIIYFPENLVFKTFELTGKIVFLKRILFYLLHSLNDLENN